MEFTRKKLDEIILLGSVGKTLPMICREIGITFDKINDERKTNLDLDDAIKRAELNADAFYIAKIRADVLSGKSSVGAKEILLDILSNETESDNEIIIREVE